MKHGDDTLMTTVFNNEYGEVMTLAMDTNLELWFNHTDIKPDTFELLFDSVNEYILNKKELAKITEFLAMAHKEIDARIQSYESLNA